jgi:hypothetical protein
MKTSLNSSKGMCGGFFFSLEELVPILFREGLRRVKVCVFIN